MCVKPRNSVFERTPMRSGFRSARRKRVYALRPRLNEVYLDSLASDSSGAFAASLQGSKRPVPAVSASGKGGRNVRFAPEAVIARTLDSIL